MNAPTASHWTNAQGYLVPIDKIKPIDKERNDLVLSIVDKARKQQEELRKFKNQTFADIAAFVQLSAEQYEVVIGGKKATSLCSHLMANTKLSAKFRTTSNLMNVYKLQKL